jgi:hypothetical protein
MPDRCLWYSIASTLLRELVDHVNEPQVLPSRVWSNWDVKRRYRHSAHRRCVPARESFGPLVKSRVYVLPV